MEKVEVILIKSTIHQKPEKKATVRSLGLRKISSSRIHNLTPAVIGMIKSVSHLVKTREVK